MDPSIFNVQSNSNQKMSITYRTKCDLTLNLENANNNMKFFQCNAVDSPTPLLSSPDVNKFKLSTPDILKLFPGINQKTPTPNTPSLFIRNYNDDYSQTLESFTEAEYNPSVVQVDMKSNMSNNHLINDALANEFIHLENQYPTALSSVDLLIPNENIAIKEEPQIITSLGSSPRLSPIDMDTQEAIKLERKRSRNRLAASKCRKRKLERIAKLEEKVKLLKGENNDLNQLLSRLKAQVYSLKQKVVKHHNNGCPIVHQ